MNDWVKNLQRGENIKVTPQDMIYAHRDIQEMLRNRDFHLLEEIFSSFDVTSIHPVAITGVLRYCNFRLEHIPSWTTFRNQAHIELVKRNKDADAILKGLFEKAYCKTWVDEFQAGADVETSFTALMQAYSDIYDMLINGIIRKCLAQGKIGTCSTGSWTANVSKSLQWSKAVMDDGFRLPWKAVLIARLPTHQTTNRVTFICILITGRI